MTDADVCARCPSCRTTRMAVVAFRGVPVMLPGPGEEHSAGCPCIASEVMFHGMKVRTCARADGRLLAEDACICIVTGYQPTCPVHGEETK